MTLCTIELRMRLGSPRRRPILHLAAPTAAAAAAALLHHVLHQLLLQLLLELSLELSLELLAQARHVVVGTGRLGFARRRLGFARRRLGFNGRRLGFARRRLYDRPPGRSPLLLIGVAPE